MYFKTEVGGWRVPGQAGQHSEPSSKPKRTTNKQSKEKSSGVGGGHNTGLTELLLQGTAGKMSEVAILSVLKPSGGSSLNSGSCTSHW